VENPRGERGDAAIYSAFALAHRSWQYVSGRPWDARTARRCPGPASRIRRARSRVHMGGFRPQPALAAQEFAARMILEFSVGFGTRL